MSKSTVSFKLINWIKKKSIGYILVILIIIYFFISILFGIGYYLLAKNNQFMANEKIVEEVDEENSLSGIRYNHEIIDYVYFSFITASTIGYGDYYPTAAFGKALVIFQSVFCSVYVAIMMSIITSKFIWPTQNTIVFSSKILYNPEKDLFQIRIINTNSMPIINPEIRMAMTEHKVGNTIAGVLELDNGGATPIYLGKYDFILNLGSGKVQEDKSEREIILDELKKAILHQNNSGENNSRFRITVTISGSNGVQSIAEMKQYYATDFVEGIEFEAIQYDDKNADELGIKYRRIPNFWAQFEKIKNEKQLNEIICGRKKARLLFEKNCVDEYIKDFQKYF